MADAWFHTPSRTLFLGTGNSWMAPLKASQAVSSGLAPTHSRPLVFATGHQGWLPQRHRRGWYWAWPHTPIQASHARHWHPRIAPLEASQEVVLGVVQCALQAPHSRHWPPRMAPLGPPQGVVSCVAPTPPRPLIPATGHQGWPPLEAQHRVVLSVAAYTPQASHPRNWPPRVAP